jgi:hypothetical protein
MGRSRTLKIPSTVFRCLVVMIAAWIAAEIGLNPPARAQSPRDVPVVHVPHFEQNIDLAQGAIFWLGQVNPSSNYADVRIGYNDQALEVDAHIFDRQIWYDVEPLSHELTQWDAVTLFLHLDQNSEGDTPSPDSYRFVAQFNHGENPNNYQTVAQGSSPDWVVSSVPFTATTGWRGEGTNDDKNDRGWVATFHIPFSSLGLPSAPSSSAVWRAALIVHDRDDAAGTLIADQSWPQGIDTQHPSTWGQLVFNKPAYTPPPASPGETVMIRQGLNGVSVADAHVGGHSTCGQEFWPQFFDGWGDANYAGYEQINIQNQWDVADWPCFSKYYVTFPISTIPPGKTIISATFTMHLFGNAGYEPGQAKPSLLQVATITEAWSEDTLTWNNAPKVQENIATTWVEPVDGPTDYPGVPVKWDVSGAMAESYAGGIPLQLVIYSADGAYHSGKYFSSSDTGDWNAEARPTLQVLWGEPQSPGDPGEPGTPEDPGEPEPPTSSTNLYLPILLGDGTR